MKKRFLSVALIAALVATTFTACKKDSEVAPEQQEEVVVQDNNDGASEAEDLASMAEDALAQASGGRLTGTGLCGATISFSGSPKRLAKDVIVEVPAVESGRVTIDFGTGKTCDDKKVRKGKIIVDYSNRSRAKDASRSFTFEGYSVDGVTVSGTKTVTFTSATTASISASLTFAKEGKSFTWSSSRTRTINAEAGTVTITGSSSGTTREGIKFSSYISQGLVFKVSCVNGRMPVSGVISVVPANAEKQRVIDFGAGDCDRKYTVTLADVLK